MTTEILGYLSGAVILSSFIPYIKDIFLNQTKPERMSWLIWAISGFISFSSQWAKGATYSLVLTAAQTVGDSLIFFLAIKYGFGGLMKRDIIALAGAAVSLVLWYLTREAAIALFIVIVIDAIGTVLTVLKTYQYPTTEPFSAWVLTFFGGLLASFAVGKFDLILLAFPVYICLASLAILVAIPMGRAAQRKMP